VYRVASKTEAYRDGDLVPAARIARGPPWSPRRSAVVLGLGFMVALFGILVLVASFFDLPSQ
jgi:hypothetical protein